MWVRTTASFEVKRKLSVRSCRVDVCKRGVQVGQCRKDSASGAQTEKSVSPSFLSFSWWSHFVTGRETTEVKESDKDRQDIL